MGSVRVRYNYLPRVIRALPQENADAIKETVDTFERELTPRLWIDTGILRSTLRDENVTKTGATVSVGYWAGRGFIAGFLEWGTVNMAARPVVTPFAHEFEPQFARIIGSAVRRACEVGR